MKPESIELLKKLEKHLDDLVKVYRNILEVVRKERDYLIESHLDDLNENNRTKEALLIKAKSCEDARIKTMNEFIKAENLSPNAKLLDVARLIGGADGERFRKLQSVLELLFKRVKEYNAQNETLVKSALDNITGAMDSITNVLKDKGMYKKTGSVESRPAESGQLVQKKA